MENTGAAPPKAEHKPVKLLITIVDRGRGTRVLEICAKEYCNFHLSFMGRGTADTDLLDYLGLGETKKDIVFSIVLEEKLERVMEALHRELKLDDAGGGIAFTIPISSVGGPMTLKFISGLYETFHNNGDKRGECLG